MKSFLEKGKYAKPAITLDPPVVDFDPRTKTIRGPSLVCKLDRLANLRDQVAAIDQEIREALQPR